MLFVHSSFRVSSTWFWTRLRANPAVRAYYDVFHERLASLDRTSLETFTTTCWSSRHPIAGPYFAEYRPLLQPAGGIPFFEPRMSFWDFIPASGPAGAITDGEHRYLAALVTSAQEAGKIPVLTCARSLGRVAGIRAAMGGAHVLLVRDLHHQWLSYVDQTNAGTYYFLNATLATILDAPHDAFCVHLRRRCISEEPCRDGTTIARFISMQTFLRAFLALHAYLYMHAVGVVDHVVDVSALARSSDAVRHAEEAIAGLAGFAVSLADARDERVDLAVPPDALAGLPEFLAEALAVARETAGLAPDAPGVLFATERVTRFCEAVGGSPGRVT